VSAPAHRAVTAAWWAAALLVASTLIVVTGFRTHDADSRVYITIASHLADQPMDHWIAPQWWGVWGMQGLYREHPIGTFIPPALLIRAGVPGAQASFIIGFAAQMICLWVLVALAATRVPVAWARALLWTLQLIPVAFVFRIRANQEYLMLAGFIVALYGTERARRDPVWVIVALLGFLYALSVKGMLALIGPPLCALWLLTTSERERRWPLVAWAGVALMMILTPVVATLYERAYVSVTGDSFLHYYMGLRLGLEGDGGSGWPFPFNKIWNAGWYAAHVVWYGAPWSALLAGGVVMSGAWRKADLETRGWLRFTLLASLAVIAVVASRELRSDRYTFPAYFIAGAGGTVLAAAWWPRCARWTEALDRIWPWGPTVLWFVLFLTRFVWR
jgi:hypothetical protein